MDTDTIRAKALYRAIKTAGSVRKLAELLGKPHSTVSMWRIRNRIPAECVLDVERVTGVSRTKLRPDIYPEDEA